MMLSALRCVVICVVSLVLLTCTETHVSTDKDKAKADKQPASLKIETSGEDSTVVTIKVSILDADGKLITAGFYASSALKVKHRCGSEEMAVYEQYAIEGVAKINFIRANEDCIVSVEYSNLSVLQKIAPLESGESPVTNPITLGIIDKDGNAVTSTSKFKRIDIRTVGVHLTTDTSGGNEITLRDITATLKVMCDYDDDSATYEKQLCIGRKKINSSGVASVILAGEDYSSDSWDSDGDGHDDGNAKCYASVFTEPCRLEAHVNIIDGSRGNVKKEQKFEFHQLGLELTDATGNPNTLISTIDRGLTSATALSNDVLKSIRVYPTENNIRLNKLEAFRPLKRIIGQNGGIETTRANEHNLHVRIGVESCRFSGGTLSYRALQYANPRLPAADYDSKPIKFVGGVAFASFFDDAKGWYRLAWDRLVKYDTGTPTRNKNGPGVQPIDVDNSTLCDGHCFATSSPNAASTICRCTTGSPVCLVDGDDNNCHEHLGYVCKDLVDDANCLPTRTNDDTFTYSDDIYKQTIDCKILVEMSRGEIEAPDQLPVCSDDPATQNSCYAKTNGYDDLPPVASADSSDFCQTELCESASIIDPSTNPSDEEQFLNAQKCPLVADPTPTTLKCIELLRMRQRIDSWHKLPEWAQNTITASKTLSISNP